MTPAALQGQCAALVADGFAVPEATGDLSATDTEAASALGGTIAALLAA